LAFNLGQAIAFGDEIVRHDIIEAENIGLPLRGARPASIRYHLTGGLGLETAAAVDCGAVFSPTLLFAGRTRLMMARRRTGCGGCRPD
jgi:hypothetical protein